MPATRNRQRRNTRCHDGFTLIELLVVISIIALLISILLPALGSARKAAEHVACLSDQRQVGLGMSAYLADYEERFTPAWQARPAGPWNRVLSERGYTSETMFNCPAMEQRFNMATGDTWSHYAINYPGLTLGYNTGSGPARLSEVLNPSDTIEIVDVRRFNTYGGSYIAWYSFQGSAATYGNPDPRHLNTINVLWVDGRATSVQCPEDSPQDAYLPGKLGAWRDATVSRWMIN